MHDETVFNTKRTKACCLQRTTWIELEIIKQNKPGTERQVLCDLTHVEPNKVDFMEVESRMVTIRTQGKLREWEEWGKLDEVLACYCTVG
jgi:hypothetical protein